MKKKSKKSGNGDQRSCEYCRTTSTPMWRLGPTGPKSLCNACGLKYTKEKRESMGIKSEKKKKKMKKNKNKKRLRATKSERLGEIERAAMLLMALSCGKFYFYSKK